MVQNSHATEQWMYWEKTNKELTLSKMVLFPLFVFSNWLRRAYFIVTVHKLHRSSYGKEKTLKHYQLASNDAGNPRPSQTLFVTPGPSCRHNQTT